MKKLFLDLEISLKSKLSSEVFLELEDQSRVRHYLSELQLALDAYNEGSILKRYGNLLINTAHLNSIYSENLPNITSVFSILDTDDSLREDVLKELAISEYFQEVWNIKNPSHLLVSLLILLYRGYMLHSKPVLRKDGAQISSTIEEMLVILCHEGSDTEAYQAIKHWVLDWEDEGFAESLSGYLA